MDHCRARLNSPHKLQSKYSVSKFVAGYCAETVANYLASARGISSSRHFVFRTSDSVVRPQANHAASGFVRFALSSGEWSLGWGRGHFAKDELAQHQNSHDYIEQCFVGTNQRGGGIRYFKRTVCVCTPFRVREQAGGCRNPASSSSPATRFLNKSFHASF